MQYVYVCVIGPVDRSNCFYCATVTYVHNYLINYIASKDYYRYQPFSNIDTTVLRFRKPVTASVL